MPDYRAEEAKNRMRGLILKNILNDGDTLLKRLYFNKYNDLVNNEGSKDKDDAAKIIQEFVEKKLKAKQLIDNKNNLTDKLKMLILKYSDKDDDKDKLKFRKIFSKKY